MILQDHRQEKKRKKKKRKGEKQTRTVELGHQHSATLNTTHMLIGVGHQLSRNTTHKRRQER
jgi:mannose-6-phosphate isomerase-like protein (cupin superfamily)